MPTPPAIVSCVRDLLLAVVMVALPLAGLPPAVAAVKSLTETPPAKPICRSPLTGRNDVQ